MTKKRKGLSNFFFFFVDVIVVIQAIGSAPQKLSAYLRAYTGNVHTQVVSVDEDDETADALRAVKDKIDVREKLLCNISNMGNPDVIVVVVI